MIFSYQLVVRCKDPDRVAAFWANVLDVPPPARDTAGFAVDDPERRHVRMRFVRSSGWESGRGRVRFELGASAPYIAREVEDLRALGAVPEPGEPHSALQDPEGNAFTVTGGPRGGPRRIRTVIADAFDPQELAEFWAAVLGFELGERRCDPPAGWLRLVAGELVSRGRPVARIYPADAAPPDRMLADLAPALVFDKRDELAPAADRVRLEVMTTDADALEAEEGRLRALGAGTSGKDGAGLLVMRDPEGNPFYLRALAPEA